MSAARYKDSEAEEMPGSEEISGSDYAFSTETYTTGAYSTGEPAASGEAAYSGPGFAAAGNSAVSSRALPSGALLSSGLSTRAPAALQVNVHGTQHENAAGAPAVSRALARGLVLARASKSAQDTAIHGQLVGLGGTRVEQIANLEYRLSSIAARRGSPIDRAQEVLVLLRQLMARETGTPHLDDALPLFFRRLGAENHIQHLVAGLVRDATSVMTSSRVSERFNTPGGVVESLDFLLGWYIRRTASLQALDDVSVGDDREECLFNIRVTHDASWAGEAGVEVSCGLRLLGRAAQPLWLKLFVRSEGRPVAPREGYHLWVDDTEPLLVANEDAGARVAAVMQITPLRQRQVVDRVSLFLPYASLLLPAGSREVELELGLFDEHGFPVFEASQLETLSIPRRSQQELALAQPGVIPAVRIPSPQSLELWSESPVSGTRIQNVTARVVARESMTVVASRTSSASVEAIEVSFDLVLCGHSGQTLYVESRVLERSGNAISATSSSEGVVNGALSIRQVVHPEGSFQVLREATLQFPTTELALDPGTHDLFVEVSLLGTDDRVLVGTLVPLTLVVSNAPVAREEGAKLRSSLTLSEQLIGLQMRVCSAEPGHDLSPQRKRTIRIESCVRDERGARALLRMKSSVETADGRLLLADTVLIPVDPVTREFRYVGHFDEQALVGILTRAESERGSRGEKLSTAVIGPQKLCARVEWCSSEDQSLMSQTVPVALAGHLSNSPEAQTPEVVTDETRVVDVAFGAAPLVGESGVGVPSAIVSWVVPAHEVGGNLPCLFAELLDAAGEPLGIVDSSTPDSTAPAYNEATESQTGALRGTILRADPSLRELHIKRGGLVLCSLPLMVRAEEWKKTEQLKLMSFSASGRVTQVVTISLGKSSSPRLKAARPAGKEAGEEEPRGRRARPSSTQSWLQRVLG